MKTRFILIFLSCLQLIVSCNNSPKVKTYKDAEREFRSSLTSDDTLSVKYICDSFLADIQGGRVDYALSQLYIVENNVLYKLSEETLDQLRVRFTSLPVVEYEMTDFNLSTAGINDVCYRYSFNGPLLDGGAIKITFNPVKVGENWYLCLKDGKTNIHPDSPAPYPIRIHLDKN